MSEHPDIRKLTGPDRRLAGLAMIPVVLGVLLVMGLAVLWPRGTAFSDLSSLGFTDEVYRATVSEVEEHGCSFAPDEPCVFVTFTLLEGPTPGTIDSKEFGIVPGTPQFEVGQRVLLGFNPDAPATQQYQFADYERRWVLWTIGGLFALAVVGLGRLRGLAALAGLAVSLGILMWFVVPAILEGRNPVAVAAVGAGAIGYLALYLAHGFTRLTHVAVVGTFVALAITVVLSGLSVELAGFTGFTGEDSFIISFVGNIDVRGLVLAGIVLGAVGALDDVTVTQASAVWEVRRANPALGVAELFAAGLRVGKDHIASTVNTLLLAYAGASMPLLLRFALSNQPTGIVFNSEILATEVVRTLVGSIGLVSAVPITTWLAARVAHATSIEELGHAH
ncbi:MAG: YibE/F family protein [Acidimicrobiia bacterium]|nr:YibE/F family protein [Acidimicrobiia bacterium]